MAVKKSSAEKRYEQSERRRLHNKAIKSECKTFVRHFIELVHEKKQEDAVAALKVVYSKLDSARSKGVLKRNAVARKKSRMASLLNTAFAQA